MDAVHALLSSGPSIGAALPPAAGTPDPGDIAAVPAAAVLALLPPDPTAVVPPAAAGDELASPAVPALGLLGVGPFVLVAGAAPADAPAELLAGVVVPAVAVVPARADIVAPLVLLAFSAESPSLEHAQIESSETPNNIHVSHL
jgi:hypothetical protein